jgi:hypothetical protein
VLLVQMVKQVIPDKLVKLVLPDLKEILVPLELKALQEKMARLGPQVPRAILVTMENKDLKVPLGLKVLLVLKVPLVLKV